MLLWVKLLSIKTSTSSSRNVGAQASYGDNYHCHRIYRNCSVHLRSCWESWVEFPIIVLSTSTKKWSILGFHCQEPCIQSMHFHQLYYVWSWFGDGLSHFTSQRRKEAKGNAMTHPQSHPTYKMWLEFRVGRRWEMAFLLVTWPQGGELCRIAASQNRCYGQFGNKIKSWKGVLRRK